MSAFEFAFNEEKASQINTKEAVQLLRAIRREGESIWLQTFADGPDACYVVEEKTAKSGRPYTIKHWCVAGVPSGKKLVKMQGVAERGHAATFTDLASVPHRVANLARVGVFFCVNVLAQNAERRKSENVVRVAAVFLDLDGVPLPTSFPVTPTAIVQSSTGKHHVYWAVDGVLLDEFHVIQKHLAELYSADPSVSDLPRVMRLPGYYHGKEEPGQLVRLTSITPEARYTRADLLEAWPTLADALAAAESQRKQQLEDAERRRTEADQLLKSLTTETAGSKVETLAKYGQVALLGCSADILSASVGERNTKLNGAAYRIGRLIGAGVIDAGEARTELLEAAEQTGLERSEILATLSSALEAGKRNPVDLAGVAQLVGVKRPRGGDLSSALITAATHEAAAQTKGEAYLPMAEEVPRPQGEDDSYSDRQIMQILGLRFPTLAAETDKAHAYRLRQLTGDDLGYIAEMGAYVAWNGRQWLSGGKKGPGQIEARRRVQELGLAMSPEVDLLLALLSVLSTAAAQAKVNHGFDSKEAKVAQSKLVAMERAYYDHAQAAKATEFDSKQRAILSSAQTLYLKDVRDFEPRPWLIGFQNGVWDQGTFREARREDHMLTLAAVAYQPDADRSDWLAVLERMTGGDTDLQHTLQDLAGYALSGASTLRLLPWLYGPAGTGKSTFSELLATVLGDMAAVVDPKHLSANASRERLGAVIWGKRSVICTEAGNQRLDAEVLKTLSGADRLAVRLLFGEAFTSRPSHVLLMVANDAPRMDAYDDALKDRVLAIPFNHPLEVGDPLLGGEKVEKVRQDPSSPLVHGFTAWAVEGLTRIHANQGNEIHRAAVCRAATHEFWQDVDPLNEFWLTLDPGTLEQGVSIGTLRGEYESWCHCMGSRPLSSQKFNRACKSVGLDTHSNGRERRWKLLDSAAFPKQT